MEKPDPSAHERDISDQQVYELLQRRVDEWNFEEHDDEENFAFAHQLTHEISDVFTYLNYGASEEFSAEELPDSIKPIYLTLWSPYDFELKEHVTHFCYPRDMVLRLKKREDHEHIPVDLPDLTEMYRQCKTHEELVAYYRANPDIAAKVAEGGEIVVDSAIYIYMHEGYSRNGIRFCVQPDGISIVVFGNQNETDELCNFMMLYHNRPRVLAETAAKLVILAAKHCQRPRSPEYAAYYLSQLDRQALEGLGISTERSG